ncbi:MAG: DUF815 domain-containing protein [Clostridia bacterium]|nr:DUF815 domain-containing protein [Clostridia bacterium]
MRDLKDCEPREAFALIAPLVSQSMLLRESDCVQSLRAFLAAVNAGDALLASDAYHELTACLLHAPVRRVSGDLWHDYLLHLLLCTPHAFARQAASGFVEEAAYSAMRTELVVLGSLSTLTGAALVRMIEGRLQAARLKPRQARDNIELFSTAVWSGGSARALPTPEEKQTPAAFTGELHFHNWHYGEPGLHDSYAADEALEEIYARLLENPLWEERIEDIRCFFASYGCGLFLKCRAFRYEDRLTPLPDTAIAPLPEPVCFIEQREQLTDALIRFMQGECTTHLLLYGPAGMGKTAQLLSLPYELPELRLVETHAVSGLDALCTLLASQPLKFLLLFDDVLPGSIPTDILHLLPPNVLVALTTRQNATLEWAQRIAFPPLKAEAFTRFVAAVLEEKMVLCDRASLQNACVDHQVDARDQLSVSAALRLAERLRVQGL